VAVPTGSTRGTWPPFLAAAAVGAALTLVYVWTVNGGRLDEWGWGAYALQFLLMTAPFGLVALVGARSGRAWAAAFAGTAILWGPFFYIGYRWYN
jgi:hypothetical protein